MIDIENYKRAIVWLRRSLNELQQEPDSDTARLGVLHRFQVTHNISEALLREAYISLDVDEQAASVSLRELIRRSADEGIRLSSPVQWLNYCLILENAKQAWLGTAQVDVEPIVMILPDYANELDTFARTLQQRMAFVA